MRLLPVTAMRTRSAWVSKKPLRNCFQRGNLCSSSKRTTGAVSDTDRAEHKLKATVLLVGGGFRDSPDVMSDYAAPIRPAAAAAFHF